MAMACELGIPAGGYGLYPVKTESGTMDVELNARRTTDTLPDPNAPCTIRAAIEAHLKAMKVTPNLPPSFMFDKLCKRCGDEVIFSAE